MRRRHILLSFGFAIVLLFLACVPTDPMRTNVNEIVGGTPSDMYPAVGALSVMKRQNFCTGTLITPRLVITAAHCIDQLKNFQRQGARVEFRIDISAGGNTQSIYIPVKSTENHPKWNARGNPPSFDLGVIVLNRNVTGVDPMPLYSGKMTSSWRGRDILFLGYGLIQTRPRQVQARRKYKAIIPIVRVQQDRFDNFKRDTSVCSGDSGGPAFYEENGEHYLLGVNSYVAGNVIGGRQPACDGSSTSFRLDAFLSWLQPLINQYGGNCTTDEDCGSCYICQNQKCVPKVIAEESNLCKPCTDPMQCGGEKDICVRTSEGNRCAQACDMEGCCPIGYVCEKKGGNSQCIPLNGVCQTPCAASDECGQGEECKNGQCRPQDVPLRSGACKECMNGACENSSLTCLRVGSTTRCLQECAFDSFCPDGYACEFNGSKRYCVPEKNICTCKDQSNCDQGEQCLKGICQKPEGGRFGDSCDESKACASGFQCLPIQRNANICIQPCGPSAVEAASPLGSPGSECDQGQCVLGSRCVQVPGRSFCLPESCANGRRCKNGGSCTQIRGAGQFCLCSSNQECSGGLICNKALLSQFLGQSVGACAEPSDAQTAGCFDGTECRNAERLDQVCGERSRQCFCAPKGNQGIGEDCNSTTLVCKNGLQCINTGQKQICMEICMQGRPEQCSMGGGDCIINTQGNGGLCGCRDTSQCKQGFVCNIALGQMGICKQGSMDEECGNNVCEVAKGENCTTCLEDCSCNNGQQCQADQCISIGDACGNGLCESSLEETCSTCEQDCQCSGEEACRSGICLSKDELSCGNGDCELDKGENCSNCAKDCGCPETSMCIDSECKQKNIEQAAEVAPNCPEELQFEKCDETGGKCEIVCYETSCGCNTTPFQNGQIPFFALFIMVFWHSIERHKKNGGDAFVKQ